MKKILFYESRPEWGGAQKCEMELLLGLEKYGYKTFFLSSSKGPMIKRIQQAGKPFTLIPVNQHVDQIRKEDVHSGLLFTLKQIYSLVPHLIKLLRFIMKHKIDLVYTSQFRSQIIIGFLAKMAGKKVIWHIHGEERLDNILGKMAVFSSHKIIVVSHRVRENYQSLFPRYRDKFQTIHNGIDIHQSSVKEDGKQHLKIITIGTLVPGKRQDLVIKACAKLKELGINFQLVILGEKPPWHSDEYKDSLVDLIKQKNLIDSVHLLGWVENPSAELSQADLFVLPSDTEGMPLSIIEAMAHGVPCIATNVGGVSELIEDEHSGLLIETDNVDQLANAIKRLIVFPETRKQMGINSKKRYESSFTKESFMEGVAEVINTL